MIPISRPWFGQEEEKAVLVPLRSGWVMQGPEVSRFEGAFAAFVGAQFSCAVSSGTAALHVALHTLGITSGDEVITVSHSFIATANAIRFTGAKPIFVDIDPNTFNIDPQQAEKAIGPRTRAIVCVHQMGMPCDLNALVPFAYKHSLPLIEDAACAIGSEIQYQGRWERIGKPRGVISCFSFHPRKLLTTGDGGMLTTNDAGFDHRFRCARQHGKDPPHPAIPTNSYDQLGFNYRMTDIQASIGCVQLKRIPEMVQRRRAQVERYGELLKDCPDIGLPHQPEWARSNWQSYCVRLPKHFEQAAVIAAMRERGVATGPGIMCAHREPAYRATDWSCQPGQTSCTCSGGRCQRLVHSERAQDECLILPVFHQLTEEEQETVVSSLKDVIAKM